MAWFGQYQGTTVTGNWWGDVSVTPPVVDTSGWRGPGGEWNQHRGNDDALHLAFARALPEPAKRAIERTVKDATADEARAVLEAQIDRAGQEWDERFYALLQEMQRRDMDTLRELIAWQEMLADDDDAIAVVMMLH